MGFTAAAMLPMQARETLRKNITKPSEQLASPPSSLADQNDQDRHPFRLRTSSGTANSPWKESQMLFNFYASLVFHIDLEISFTSLEFPIFSTTLSNKRHKKTDGLRKSGVGIGTEPICSWQAERGRRAEGRKNITNDATNQLTNGSGRARGG